MQDGVPPVIGQPPGLVLKLLFYTFFAEWDAMYTTQITQRAKKYSNGILRLTSCGSYQSQVSLSTHTSCYCNLVHLCQVCQGFG